MNDYLGNEIKVNDEVVYLFQSFNGKSIIAKGIVIGFEDEKVKIQRNYFDDDKMYCEPMPIDDVSPLKIVVVNECLAFRVGDKVKVKISEASYENKDYKGIYEIDSVDEMWGKRYYKLKIPVYALDSQLEKVGESN